MVRAPQLACRPRAHQSASALPQASPFTPLLLGLVLLGAGVGRCLSFPFVSSGRLALWAGQAAVIWIGAFRSLVQAASSAAQPYFCESSVRVPISQAVSSPSPHPYLPSYLTEQGEASSVNSPSCHLLPQLAGLPGFLSPSLTSGETGSLALPRAVIWMLLFLRFPRTSCSFQPLSASSSFSFICSFLPVDQYFLVSPLPWRVHLKTRPLGLGSI